MEIAFRGKGLDSGIFELEFFEKEGEQW